jgi:hypothetical protein
MPATVLSPNTGNYYIGRGVVWWKNTTQGLTTWRDLGNAPACDFKAAIKRLDHFSSRLGLKTKDDSVVIEANATLTIKLDEWTRDNLALAMMGLEGANPFNVFEQTDIQGEIFFLGTNNIGAKVAAHFPVVQITSAGTLSFISADKYGELELTGDLLLDPATVPIALGGTGTGTGNGSFGTVDWDTTLTAPP